MDSLRTEKRICNCYGQYDIRAGFMPNENLLPPFLRVLLADSRPMEGQLLADALRQKDMEVLACKAEAEAVLKFLEEQKTNVLVISCAAPTSEKPDFSLLRSAHFVQPALPKVALLDHDLPEFVVEAFRCGARGLFCLADSPFSLFCECIRELSRGGIWASGRQLGYVLDAICETRALPVVGAAGEKLLTAREEQVVALVSDGLSNRAIATELGLSEQTVKKYLFRIFEKLGISNRVELVLYAVYHSGPERRDWRGSA